MRLIDADRLKRQVEGRSWKARDKFVELIDNAPTIEVEPVKRGKWIKNEDRHSWHCSCCNVDNYYAYSWNNETGMNEFQDNYCPNCGARIEGEEE